MKKKLVQASLFPEPVRQAHPPRSRSLTQLDTRDASDGNKRTRDPVWDAFAKRYAEEYGESPLSKREFFVNLARFRRIGRTDEQMINKVHWLFAWNLYGHTGRWTFEDYIAKYDKIPSPGARHGTAKPTDRILGQA